LKKTHYLIWPFKKWTKSEQTTALELTLKGRRPTALPGKI